MIDWFSGGPGQLHVTHAAAFFMDPSTTQANTETIRLQDLVRLCPDFVGCDEIRSISLCDAFEEEAQPSFINSVTKLRLQHVSVQEFFATRCMLQNIRRSLEMLSWRG